MRLRPLSRIVLFLALTTCVCFGQERRLHAPTLTPQVSGTTNGLIAVSPVNSRVVWASGRAGTFVVTTDGGRHWRAGVVKGAEGLQFRDVQGVSERVAYLLSIGSGTDSRIYKTEDGGATWTMQFQNTNPDAFYDCIAFWTPRRGLAHSDSVAGMFPDLRTSNGTTWHSIEANMPPALAGEASFASSGTCLVTQGDSRAWIGTGGASPSRVLATTDSGRTWNAFPTPLRGSPSAGVFSVGFRDAWHGMVAGGDLDPTQPPYPETARSSDGGRTWTLTPAQPAMGTVFGLSYATGSANILSDEDDCCGQGKADRDEEAFERTVVVTGPGGAAWSPDEGDTWIPLTGVTGYWGVAFANPHAGWLVGPNGTILKISF